MKWTLRRTASLVVSILGLSIVACEREAPRGSEDHEHEHEQAHLERGESNEADTGARNEVHVSPEERAAYGIAVAVVAHGRIDSETELLGAVQPNGDRLAHIVPRFGGIARDIRKAAGDFVRAGDVLATIESNESLAPYELRTLIDGVVLARHLTRGEAVDRESSVFVIADLSNVWVDLSVYQKDLARVTVGTTVRIHTLDEGPTAEGVVSYVTPALDPETRTATARVVLANPGGRWLPGMFVAGRTLSATDAAVVVPREAVQVVAGRTSVFEEIPGGFALQPIRVGREGETLVEVLSGLSAGDRIAVKNTFLLKAELSRAEAEHQH
ncbi:MAG: efflux RND transporter periplasmic adaptor subunit [Deltaproteobacteria bacterium]|nr:efflux RND transporter periplasmic adaptor subunit [Deltaproteobacteria bacterium]